MITIKTILFLAKNYGLKNARFIPNDSSYCSIEVRNGVAWFKQPCVKEAELKVIELTPKELDENDEEVGYFTPEEWVSLKD